MIRLGSADKKCDHMLLLDHVMFGFFFFLFLWFLYKLNPFKQEDLGSISEEL